MGEPPGAWLALTYVDGTDGFDAHSSMRPPAECRVQADRVELRGSIPERQSVSTPRMLKPLIFSYKSEKSLCGTGHELDPVQQARPHSGAVCSIGVPGQAVPRYRRIRTEAVGWADTGAARCQAAHVCGTAGGRSPHGSQVEPHSPCMAVSSVHGGLAEPPME